MRRIIISFICGLVITVNICAAPATTYGPITSSDCVWDIAVDFRPSDDVSIYQVMLAIFNHNKNAFYYDNINALDSGKIIKLPDIKTIRSISKKKAYKEIERQDQEWQQGIKKSLRPKDKVIADEKSESVEQPQNLPTNNVPAINTAAQPEVLPQVDASQQVQMPAAVPQVQDDAAIKDLANRLAAAEEKNNITQNQVAQIGGRVDLIEKDVRELSEFEKKVSVCFSSKFFMWLQQYADRLSDFLGPQLFMGVIATIIIVLFILLVYLIIPRRKSTSVSYPQDESNKEGDFNHHMDTEDGAASKLNLAHAYIEMGEQNKAKILLHEVLSYGGDAEQEEAKALLDKMKADQ